jgi:hypothetical protein
MENIVIAIIGEDSDKKKEFITILSNKIRAKENMSIKHYKVENNIMEIINKIRIENGNIYLIDIDNIKSVKEIVLLREFFKDNCLIVKAGDIKINIRENYIAKIDNPYPHANNIAVWIKGRIWENNKGKPHRPRLKFA